MASSTAPVPAVPAPSSITRCYLATRDDDPEPLFQQQPDSGLFRIVMDRYALIPLEYFEPEHPKYDSTIGNLGAAVARLREGKTPFPTWEETFGPLPTLPGGGVVTVGGVVAI